jgi:hypothetical protein
MSELQVRKADLEALQAEVRTISGKLIKLTEQHSSAVVAGRASSCFASETKRKLESLTEKVDKEVSALESSIQDILSAQGSSAEQLQALVSKVEKQQHLHQQQFMTNAVLEVSAKLDQLRGMVHQQQLRSAPATVPEAAELTDEDQQLEEQAFEDEGELEQPMRASAGPALKKPRIAALLPASEDKASSAPVRLSKPAVWDGTGSADDRLFIFENYLKGSKNPEADWVLHAQPLLAAALSAWVAVAKSAPAPVPWSLFRQTMLGAFATQDAAMQARKKLHKIRQTPGETAMEYVRRFRLLIAQLGAAAPAESDMILWVHAGLNEKLKSAALVDPKTGTFWTSFEALCNTSGVIRDRTP